MDSDEVLYEKARSGSKAAFERLYEKYEKPIFGFIYRRLRSVPDSEDIFHDTMLAIFKGPQAEFSSEGAFAGWLYKVAFNLALNRLRSRNRESHAMAALKINEMTLAHSTQATIAYDLDDVSQAAEGLTKPLKDVYTHRLDGKSYEEMATLLKVPVGTVKSRVHLMVKQLREEVKKWTAK